MSKPPVEICTVVGARPQFVKAAVVSRALKQAGLQEVLVHTGQHYDRQMSGVFFEELSIPQPTVNLGVGSGPQGRQTGQMMERLEAYLLDRPELPDWLLVYGDTNSTLAAGLVAAKLQVPLVHVEAGLRSYNKAMPEEINRRLTDHMSDLLCCPTETAVKQLAKEDIHKGVYYTGDVMRDATRLFARQADQQRPLTSVADWPGETYYLSTVHRAENTNKPERLGNILQALGQLEYPVVMPLHPRTQKLLTKHAVPANVELREPVGYLSMLTLIQNARAVLTDSGGVQKEACWLATPCVTLREETEWTETTEDGWNYIVGSDPMAIQTAVRQGPQTQTPPQFGAPLKGNSASKRIAEIVCAA